MSLSIDFTEQLSSEELDELEKSPPDHQIHVNHIDCPAGYDSKRRLYIKRVFGGAVAYCHHCNESGYWKFREKNIPVLPTIVGGEYPRAGSDPWDRKILRTNFHPLSHDPDVMLYAASYDLLDYSDVYLFTDRGHLLFYHPEGVLVERVPHPKSVRTYKRDPHAVPLMKGTNGVNCVVLTEDALSALKVLKAGYTSLPLLGTNLSDTYLQHIVEQYPMVLVHLDPDVAGIGALSTIVTQLRGSGVQVIVPSLVQEPKHYNTAVLDKTYKDAIDWATGLIK